MKCPSCSVENHPEAVRCRMCGAILPGKTKSIFAGITCSYCSSDNPPDAKICSTCMRSLRPEPKAAATVIPTNTYERGPAHWSEAPASALRTWRLSLAGTLLLMAGALGIFEGIWILSTDIEGGIISALGGYVPASVNLDALVNTAITCTAIRLVFSCFAIVGAMFAIQKTRFGLAIAGAVFGILALGFFLGSILSVAALILIVISKKEFRIF